MDQQPPAGFGEMVGAALVAVFAGIGSKGGWDWLIRRRADADMDGAIVKITTAIDGLAKSLESTEHALDRVATRLDMVQRDLAIMLGRTTQGGGR